MHFVFVTILCKEKALRFREISFFVRIKTGKTKCMRSNKRLDIFHWTERNKPLLNKVLNTIRYLHNSVGAKAILETKTHCICIWVDNKRDKKVINKVSNEMRNSSSNNSE